MTLIKEIKMSRRKEWRFIEKILLVTLYISLFIIQSKCQTIVEKSHENSTKKDLDLSIESYHCHTCHSRNSNNIINENIKNKTLSYKNDKEEGSFFEELLVTVGIFTDKILSNKTNKEYVEKILDNTLNKERYEIVDGVEIKPVDTDGNQINHRKSNVGENRALLSKFTYEYRVLQKIKNFLDTHVLSLNLPRVVGFRSFGLKKLFLPILIGAQIFKAVLFAMFLPSILGSFGKIVGKGISTLSATSSQASYPPMNTEDPAYTGMETTDNKDFVGYESDPQGAYAYPQDDMYDPNQVNDLSNVDMNRFTMNGQKVAYLPSKNNYYKNQMSNNYKVFQKIPSSSMILNNYDPFYSPLLSRLDGIFARLGLAPVNAGDSSPQIGGQTLSDVKLEACREQLICLMYSSPAKYAPYSNLVSAQLSRELNELRRPVSDNPEILRFFRYMRAARRGQEGADCMRLYPGCQTNAAPAHTMIAAYQDINKLVTARKLHNS